MKIEHVELIPEEYKDIPNDKGVLCILLSLSKYDESKMLIGFKTAKTVILPRNIEQLAEEIGGFDNFKKIDYYPSKKIYEQLNREKELSR